MKTITYLMFAAGDCPGGGTKIILEHANYLVSIGNKVNIIYPAAINKKWDKSILYQLDKWRIYYKRKYIIGYSARSWFPLDERVQEYFVYSLDYKNIPSSDIYIATEARTAPYLNEYPVPIESKYYFIQGYEDWFFSKTQLMETYCYGFKNYTITTWLKNIVESASGKECPIVPNGFQLCDFNIISPIVSRNKFFVSMLYHTKEWKDIPLALSALDIVKKKYPQLEVFVFGEPKDPHLPDWYHYYRKPSAKTHLWLNNHAAIYVGSSKVEGFGLTVGEAMLCGQAVACTDNLGYKEMAKDGETALLSPCGDVSKLAENIIRLIEDDNLRIRIASNSEKFIREKFSYRITHNCLNSVLGL